MINLVLAMIVKNESKTILKTLKSCESIINKAYISDTGSTDNTINIIKEYNETINKIEIYEKEFVDFSTNRNYLFDIIEKKESKDTFILLLDASDEVKNI